MSNPQVYMNVTEAYFSVKKNQGVERKEAIIEACLATGREYNPSMYTRWTKSPQQDVLRYMQTVVGTKMLIDAGVDEDQAAILAGNLAVPVDDEVLGRIRSFLEDENKFDRVEHKSNIIKEVSRLNLNVTKKLKATTRKELNALAEDLGFDVPESYLELLDGYINAPKGKKGDTNIYRIEDHASLEEIGKLADLVANLAAVEVTNQAA